MSKRETKPVTEYIPPGLREPIGSAAVAPLLSVYLANEGVPIDAALNFVKKAVAFQDMICDDEQDMAQSKKGEGYRWFREKIRDVTIIERRMSGNRLLGKKARIIFDSKAKNSNDYDSIDTDWIEYNGFNADENWWEVALANSIMTEAKEYIGRDVSVLKHVHSDGMEKHREIINIRPIYSSSDMPDEPDEDETADDGEIDQDKIIALLEEVEFKFEDQDVDDLLEILEDPDDPRDIVDAMNDILDLDIKLSKKFRADFEEKGAAKFAVDLFIEFA